MTKHRRKLIARVIFVVDLLVCGVWVYWAAALVFQLVPGAASGGIGEIRTGPVELIFTVVPPIVTIVLARASGSTPLARRWRNTHLAVTLAMIIVPMMGGLRIMLVSIVTLVPVQLFFVVGALAIWIASPRKQRKSPSGASL